MQTRKEYLLKHGKIKEIGRGRISGENLKFLETAHENGERFSDWEPGTDKVPAKAIPFKKSTPKKETAEKPSGKFVADIHIPFPEDEYVAYERRDGKRHYRSMRSACNNCGVSLVCCRCFLSGRPARIVKENGTGSVEVFLDTKKGN